LEENLFISQQKHTSLTAFEQLALFDVSPDTHIRDPVFLRPIRKGPAIDLSSGAARAIGMGSTGNVRMEVIR
jgi:hypothetical protein